MKLPFLRTALAAIALLTTTGSFAQRAPDRSFPPKATSQEYKIVIKPDAFSDFKMDRYASQRTKVFAAYWEIAKRVARDNGMEINEKKHGIREKSAILDYLDDAKFSLDGKGYILRVVQAENKGKPANQVAITLKFRSPDPGAIRPDTVEVSTLRKADREYQDDIIGFVGGEAGRNIVEHSPAAKFKHVPYDPARTTLGQYAALFPTLGKLGLDASTELVSVGGKLHSIAVEPGYVLFPSGKGELVEAKVQMNYWSSRADGKGIVAELSYSFDLKDADEQTIAASQKYFAALQKTLAADLMPGATKVTVLYNRAGKK